MANNGFVDNSPNNLYISSHGNAGQTSFSPYGNNWSYRFDGTGDNITVPSSSALGLGTGAFVVEFWMMREKYDTIMQLFDFRTSTGSQIAGTLYLFTDNTLRYNVQGSDRITVASNSVPATGWTHIAVSRSGSTTRLFINGAVAGSFTDTFTYLSSTPLTIGSRVDGANNFRGHISNFRVTKGSGIASNFTPPTQKLTALADTFFLSLGDSRLYDASASALVPTLQGNVKSTNFGPFKPSTDYVPNVRGWSAYFDGQSTNYISVSAGTYQNFGTGDFSIEAWVLPTEVRAGGFTILDTRENDATESWVFLLKNNGIGEYVLSWYDGTDHDGSTAIPINTWTHVAVTRTGGVLKLFVNGVADLTISSYTTNVTGTASTSIIIGGHRSGASDFSACGHISNLRLNKGVASYTVNFVPSNDVPSASTYTKLLMFVDGTTTANKTTENVVVTVNGTCTSVPVCPKSYNSETIAHGAGYFDGTNSYLTIPETSFGFSTNNFTIEMWIYKKATGVMAILDGRQESANTPYLYSSSDNTIRYSVSGSDRITSTALPINCWHHIAISRNSSTTRLFVNGVQSGSAWTTDNTTYDQTALRVGCDISNSNFFSGWISNLRITNASLYSGTFTASSTPLTPTAQTALLINFSAIDIADYSRKNHVEIYGNVHRRTSALRSGSHMYFDGTTSYVKIPLSNDLELGQSRFTIEGFFCATQYGSQFILDCRTAPNQAAMVVEIGSQNQLSIYVAGATRITSAINAVSLGGWHHFSISRSGGVNALHLDGVVVGSWTDSNSTDYIPCPMYIGARYDGQMKFKGYIESIRVTRNMSRYPLTNYTAPTAPFASS